jgi:hypothetical protein
LLELDALYEKRSRARSAEQRRAPLSAPRVNVPFARLTFETAHPIAALFHRGTNNALQDAVGKFFLGERGASRTSMWSGSPSSLAT